jgi:hypothetical protein
MCICSGLKLKRQNDVKLDIRNACVLLDKLLYLKHQRLPTSRDGNCDGTHRLKCFSGKCDGDARKKFITLEIALVLVRLDHVASVIVNTDDSVM